MVLVFGSDQLCLVLLSGSSGPGGAMRTNHGDGQPTRARSGRRLVPTTALLAATALVIALAGTIQPAAAHPAAPGSPAQAAGTPHTVSFDGYSFLIDGQRTYIWSGEFHYFR